AVGIEQMQRRLDATREVRVVDEVQKALGDVGAKPGVRGSSAAGPCGPGQRQAGIEARVQVEQAAGAAAGGGATLEQPFDAELQLVGQRDLGDGDIDDHLPLRDVELLERRLDDRVLGGCGDHQQRVV